MRSIVERDALVDNLLDRIDALEAAVKELQRAIASGLFEGEKMVPPGGLKLTLPTQALEVVDSGTAGATQQAWVEVENDGVTGYLHVHGAK